MTDVWTQIRDKIVGYVIAAVLLTILLIAAYHFISTAISESPVGSAISSITTGIGTAIDTLKGGVDRGVGKPLGCAADETYRAGLCYKSCTANEESDGTQKCYQNPPSGWPGGKTITHLQHKTIYSSVGTTNTIPTTCSGGLQNHAGLCYDVPSGWKVTAPGFIGETCESIKPGFTRDDGTGCWIDADTYGRGAGRDPGLGSCPSGWVTDGLLCREPVSCASGWNFFTQGCSGGTVQSRPANSCAADEEKYGALCYPKCRAGYSPSGCCTCLRPASVTYRKVKSQVGSLPTGCPAGKELFGRLCYPTCPSSPWPYQRTGGNIEYCTSKCPSGWKDIGVGGCERPMRDVGLGKPIHACAAGMEEQAGLCYKPCGAGYVGVASTCWPTKK